MNIRDLEYLIAISEENHFRKAAEKCFVSQPTLSGQIKKLEKHLGVKLIERTKKKVYFTDVGLKVVEKAKLILSEVKNIEDISKSFKRPMSGKIKIAIIPTLSPYLLPIIINPIKNKYPNLETILFELKTDSIIKKLNFGDIDLGILALPLEEKGLKEEVIFQEEFYVATSIKNSLAKRKSLNLTDIIDQKILLLEEGHCLSQNALEVCSLIGIKHFGDFRATSMETLRHMLIVENAVTLIPKLAVNHYLKLKEQSIKYIPLNNPPKRKIGFIYRRSTVKNECLNNLKNVIKEIVNKHL